MTILGGAGTLTGPMVGAIIVTMVKNVASTYVERWKRASRPHLRAGGGLHAHRARARLRKLLTRKAKTKAGAAPPGGMAHPPAEVPPASAPVSRPASAETAS